MLRIGKMADYALLVTNCLVKKAGVQVNTDDIALATQLPGPTVRKILKQLVDGGVVVSHRGVHGGYRLAREATQIAVADVLVAMEGPIAVTQCTHDVESCDLHHHCDLQGNWSYINHLVFTILKNISIAEMAINLNNKSHNVHQLKMHLSLN